MKKKINSRDKGCRGEREVAKVLTDAGFSARRGQQFSGSKDSPDVVCESLPQFHFEVKFTQKTAIYDWMEQASNDGIGKVPIVVHRRNGDDWVVILKMKDFLELVKLQS